MDIKLLNKSSSQVTTFTYELEVDGRKYTLLEYENESGRVIDEELRDAEGESVFEPALLEEIQTALEASGHSSL